MLINQLHLSDVGTETAPVPIRQEGVLVEFHNVFFLAGVALHSSIA